ncbi:MAG: two-component sensor histidine kinase [uncultured bacterium]|nr:MAG: two-component sensor histidine kinase [uncultured bacterium]
MRVKKINLKVKISTRLLAYFLFVTILPLFILAISSTLLINSTLNDKLIQELDEHSENVWELYNNSITDFKNSISSIPLDALQKNLSTTNSLKLNYNITNQLQNILKRDDYHLVMLFNQNKKLISSEVKKEFFLNPKTITGSSFDLQNSPNSFKNNISLSNEVISLKDLQKLGIIKSGSIHNQFDNQLGFFLQIGIIRFQAVDQDYYLLIGHVLNENSKFLKQLKNIYGITVTVEHNNNIVLSNQDKDKKTIITDITPTESTLDNIFNKQVIINNKNYRSSIYVLKNISAKSVGKLVISIPEEDYNNLKSGYSSLISQITVLISIAGIILAYLLARTITKPLSIVTDAAKDIENGDFSKRVVIKSTDELGYLAKSFNNMAAALQKRKELEQIRDDLAATLTHDLRVPLLASVQALEQLLKGSYGSLAEKQQFIIDQLIINNKDLLKMVNTILDSYKYEAGKQTLIKRKVNFNKLIDESICEVEPLAIEKNHEVIFMPHCDKIEVIADRQEIKRVIINLLSNAIVYTLDQGKIEIFTQLKDQELIFSVKDNGIGISESSIKNLFQRYSKGSKTLRRIGTGLGLYLSKHIIEAHNGKIWVESVKDQGSTFYFSIPFINEEEQNINE